jgi:ATP-dependent Lhr-like helicase
VVLETVRECLQDTFDVPALTGLMRDLASRKIRMVEVETPAPSPFARSLLFRYVGAFMYEGDSPLAERRAQALALDSSLLADLLGQADLRELLDPAVVAQTEAELQRLAANRASRDLEAVADMLRAIGPLSAQEVADRCTDAAAAPDWLAELAAARRTIEVRVAGEARWAAIEDAGRLRDALGVPLPVGVPAAFTEPVPDPLGDLVARYARGHGPFTTADVAHRYGLGQAVVTGALHRLAAQHRVTEGEFLPGGRGTEWCDVEVLRLVRRRCLAKLRKEAEPVPPEVLAAFLPGWQNAGQPVGRPGAGTALGKGQTRVAGRWRSAPRAGPDTVYDTIAQLAGAQVPASALEALVLPGRVPGYQPAILDELTSAGEIVWAGAGGLPGGDGWLVLTPAHVAPLLLPPVTEITMTAVHEAVLAALEGGGGLFFRMICDRVGSLLVAGGHPAPPDLAVAAAIWDLVWAGHLTNDTLAPLRTVLSTGGTPGTGVARGRGGHASARGRRGGAGTDGTGASSPGGDGAGRGGGAPESGNGTSLAPGGVAYPAIGSTAEAGLGRLRATGGGMIGRGAGRRHGYGRPLLPSRTGPPTVSGRWSLLPEREADPTRRLHAIAQTMLDRHGILTRGAVVSERLTGGFGALYPVLRAMEEAGQCRRGYFVEGLGAAQFALPGAVDRMRALGTEMADLAAQGPVGAATGADAGFGPGPDASGTPAGGWQPPPSDEVVTWERAGGTRGRAGPANGGYSWGPPGSGPAAAGEPGRAGAQLEAVVLAAGDPANPFGAALPWPERPGEVPGAHRPGRKAGALVVMCRGHLVLYVERGGKTLLSWTSDPAELAPVAAALAAAVRGGALGRLTVERADGSAVYDTPLAQALADAGFRPTPRGLRLRG